MITVREFLADINEEIKHHPELLDMPIIYAVDDEGNDYKLVSCNTTKCYVEDSNVRHLEVYTDSESYDEVHEFNALLIN